MINGIVRRQVEKGYRAVNERDYDALLSQLVVAAMERINSDSTS